MAWSIAEQEGPTQINDTDLHHTASFTHAVFIHVFARENCYLFQGCGFDITSDLLHQKGSFIHFPDGVINYLCVKLLNEDTNLV